VILGAERYSNYYTPQWGMQGGAVWDNCSPQSSVAPLEWRPFALYAPLFGAHGSTDTLKNTQK